MTKRSETRWARPLTTAAGACLLAVCAAVGASAQSPAVHTVLAPEGCFVPDAAMGARGVLHRVYGLNRNAYHVRSTDNGAMFTPPVQVNSAGEVEYRMGERGPKLAVGGDGVIHVVWMDCWAPGVKTYVRYSRSLDGGRSFGSLQTLSTASGVDGATVTADGRGHVVAFWHVASPPQDEIPQATWLHLARSSENGATFTPDEHVRVANLPGLACSMCMMRARIAPDGDVVLAFRTAVGNIRDFYVLKGAPQANDFAAVRMDEDNWEIDYCPMCGPELTLMPGGGLLCAFMSRNRVYWAVSDDAVSAFRLHVATPANEQDEIYPTALANRRGQVLFVWQVGPMAVDRQAAVKWALYDGGGRMTGEQGAVGVSASGTKATAFVGSDDSFYIVTTAR
jgi:hypothetical protein